MLWKLIIKKKEKKIVAYGGNIIEPYCRNIFRGQKLSLPLTSAVPCMVYSSLLWMFLRNVELYSSYKTLQVLTLSVLYFHHYISRHLTSVHKERCTYNASLFLCNCSRNRYRTRCQTCCYSHWILDYSAWLMVPTWPCVNIWDGGGTSSISLNILRCLYLVIYPTARTVSVINQYSA
jgi:hypothetical protein